MAGRPPVPPELEGYVGWILGEDGRTPVKVPLEEAVAWMNANGTVRVALDEDGRGSVSTVFIPRMERDGIEPSLFETLSYGPDGEERIEKSRCWEEAERRHRAVAMAIGLIGPDPTVH